MSIIYLTLGVSFFLAAAFLGSFIWAAKHHQYDDYESPSHRMLFDDEVVSKTETNQTNQQN